MDNRQQQLQQWVEQTLGIAGCTLIPLAADASFRRYFRLVHQGKSLLALDSPPELEDNHALVQRTALLQRQQLSVPDIYAQDLQQGFLLLQDFGDDLYFSQLNGDNADALYRRAIDDLLILAQTTPDTASDLPCFDSDELGQELQHFKQWYLQTHGGLSLTAADEQRLQAVFTLLIDNALVQPQVCVHRDYHSRNLLVLPQQGVGIIDFQDALWGPLTYDLVSLIRDCYVTWPTDKVNAWLNYFYQQLVAKNYLDTSITRQTLQRWFDLMGVHRHLKAIFIFARKYHRDNNPHYLNDIPRALGYIHQVLPHYPELAPLEAYLQRVESLPC